MKKLAERGQGVLVIVLLGAIVVAVVYFGLLANQSGIQEGAETIGEAVGDAIDNAPRDHELKNEIWIAQNAVAAWVGNQRALEPNKHAIEAHGDDAWATVRCYNKNGTFHVVKTTFDGIHLLCRDDDGSIRDLIVNQQAKSNVFEMDTAYTPKDGTLREVMKYINSKLGAGKFTFPENSTILVDGKLLP